MWSKAMAAGVVTKLGMRLGDDVLRIIRANALLGYGVPGISAKRAVSSITHATCSPLSAARTSDGTNDVSSPTRHAVILIATVRGSNAARSMNFAHARVETLVG